MFGKSKAKFPSNEKYKLFSQALAFISCYNNVYNILRKTREKFLQGLMINVLKDNLYKK